jgi:hypothetical protein
MPSNWEAICFSLIVDGVPLKEMSDGVVVVPKDTGPVALRVEHARNEPCMVVAHHNGETVGVLWRLAPRRVANVTDSFCLDPKGGEVTVHFHPLVRVRLRSGRYQTQRRDNLDPLTLQYKPAGGRGRAKQSRRGRR